MIYNIIVGSITVIALVAIIYIVARKIPKLKTLDIATIAEEKQARVKDRILIDRLKRKSDKSKAIVHKISKPFWEGLKNFFSKIYYKVIALEKKYQRESARKPQVRDAVFEEKIKSLINDADELLKSEEYSEAEKKYIEIISFDASYKKAYQGLANLYIAQKEFLQAIQTIKYVLKLDLKESKPIDKVDSKGSKYRTYTNADELTEDYIKLGEVYLAEKKYSEARTNFEKALSYLPHDPKTLDLLIDICLILKDKTAAILYFNKLQEVNPENQKLNEYGKKIEEIK